MEVMLINESITTNNATSFHKETGEDPQEDKEEEDDPNIIQPMPPLPWTTHLSPWICLEAMPQTIGEGKADNKEIGGNKDLHKGIKDSGPKFGQQHQQHLFQLWTGWTLCQKLPTKMKDKHPIQPNWLQLWRRRNRNPICWHCSQSPQPDKQNDNWRKEMVG